MNETEQQVRNAYYKAVESGRSYSQEGRNARLLATLLAYISSEPDTLSAHRMPLHTPDRYPQKERDVILRTLMAEGEVSACFARLLQLCRAWEEENAELKGVLLPLYQSLVPDEETRRYMNGLLNVLCDSCVGVSEAAWSKAVERVLLTLPAEETGLPEGLAALAAAVLTHLKTPEPGSEVYDPFCGSGVLLAAMYARGVEHLYGETPSLPMWACSRFRMLMAGRRYAGLRLADALAAPSFAEGGELRLFDYVLSAPPLAFRYDVSVAEQDVYGRFERGVPGSSNGEWAYLLHMLAQADPKGGVVAAFVSGGTLFRADMAARLRRSLTEENVLEAVIALPTCTLGYTAIPPMLLVLRKGRTRRTVRFVNAQGLGQRTRRQTLLSPEDIEKILAALATEEPLPGFARSVTAEEIAAADYVWSVNRYVLPEAEETRIDLPRLQADIERLERELAAKQAQLDALLAAW